MKCQISIYHQGTIPWDSSHPSFPSSPNTPTSSSSSRPVTTDLVARRLVAGALGLKLGRREGGKDLKESQKIKEVRGKYLFIYIIIQRMCNNLIKITEQREKERKRIEQREKDLNDAWDE